SQLKMNCIPYLYSLCLFVRDVMFFFFQAEDGIRDLIVTGVQTCALPISASASQVVSARPSLVQSIAFPRAAPLLRFETMSSTESPRIAMPYQSGKKPAPGPSGPRYSHCRAWITM